MKLEPRGKYPGVKIHLDEKETRDVLDIDDKASTGKAWDFIVKLARKIHKLQNDLPTLLEERTEEEIRAELEEERDKSIAKLAAMDKGKDWKKVKL